jgi:hypothetical protein
MFQLIYLHKLKDVHELILVVFFEDRLNYIRRHNLVVVGHIPVAYLVLDMEALDHFLDLVLHNVEDMAGVDMNLVEVDMDLVEVDMDLVVEDNHLVVEDNHLVGDKEDNHLEVDKVLVVDMLLVEDKVLVHILVDHLHFLYVLDF